MSTRLACTLLSIAVLSLAPGLSPACDCAPPPAPEKALAEADFVFAGEVISLSPQETSFTVECRFDVEKVWKGALPEQLVVLTATDSALCGFSFEVGRRYVVYADFANPQEPSCESNWLHLRTGICHRTTAGFDEEAEALGEPLWSAPGVPFRRGDADDGGEVDISDMVRILLYLFSGGAPSSCEDTMDANDDGAVDLTDAVYGLNYLFTGGPAPPAPGPSAPGHDATPSDPFSCGDGVQLACPSDAQSTLPGVRLEIAGGPCTLTLAEAAAGVTFTYRVVVEQAQAGVVTRALATCPQPGAAGLYLLAKISNDAASFCVCDRGLCPHTEASVDLAAGSYLGTLSWCGRSWSGPSDFNNPVGDPFPPGRYRFEVRAEGRLAGGTSWDMAAAYEVELVP